MIPIDRREISVGLRLSANSPSSRIGTNSESSSTLIQRVLLAPILVAIMIACATADDFASQLPRKPPSSPAAAIEAMTVAAGFHVELVASEPNIGTPVDVCWDAKGRLFVCEMRGYSERRNEKLSRVSRLEDIDGDGFYETSTVFASDLLWPTAIVPYRDGLFVADAPNIHFLRDTNDDGIADQEQIVLTGFGTQNVQGLLNSFRWGLDSQIHVACSSNGGRIHRPGRPEQAIEVRGRDLSFDPDTFAFRDTNGGAQNGMSFDDWGNKYASSNSDHLQSYVRPNPIPDSQHHLLPAPSRLSIALDGPQAEVFRKSPTEPWRVVRTQLRVTGLAQGPIEGGGRAAGYFTGATGATIYRGDAWPAEHRGVAFVGDVGSNLIHRKRIDRSQFRPVATRVDDASEFVASSDNWFRPAQFANGPDGNLYVIDVCREVIEHPKSLPPEIKRHLDLNSGHDRGRIFRVVADGTTPRRRFDLSNRSTLELVATLAHPNAWHRQTAARLLLEGRDQAAIASLRDLALGSPSPLGRLHARYSLRGLGGLTSDILRQGMQDDSPGVRLHSIRLAAAWPEMDWSSIDLVQLVKDPDIEVRYEWALHLAQLPDPIARIVLPKMIRRDADNAWVSAALFATAKRVAGETFASLYDAPDFDSDGAQRFLRSLAIELGSTGSQSSLADAFTALISNRQRSPLFEFPILEELHRAVPRSTVATSQHEPDSLATRISKRLQATELSLRRQLAKPDQSATHLVRLIRCLGSSSSDATIDDLGQFLVHKNVEVQDCAVDILSRHSSGTAASTLIDRWNQLSITDRRSAIGRLWTRPNHQRTLIDAIESGKLARTDLSITQWQAALNSTSPRVAAFARSHLQTNPPADRSQVVAAYHSVLTQKGRANLGKQVFQKHCSSCHLVDGVGKAIGPNLLAFATRGAAPILVNVLDPNREINPQYLNYTALTTDGRIITGMIESEGSDNITLVSADGQTTTLSRDDIERLRSTGVSFMPTGLEESIDHQAMADLIAYLLMPK